MDEQVLIDQSTEQMSAVRREFQQDMKRRILLWAIRWFIGFSIIAVVVYFKPEWSWLWWVGVGFALVTPLTTLVAQKFVDRKIAETHQALAQAQRMADDADQG